MLLSDYLSLLRQGVSVQLNLQPGYDHSYYFIATFVEAHIAHHASFLKA